MTTRNRLTDRFIQSYLSALNTPRSLAILIMYRENEHDQLLAFDINPNNYLDPDRFRLDYLATKFLSKADFLSTKVDKASVALQKFLETEKVCGDINRDDFKTAYLKHKRFEWVHSATIRKIERILGDFTGEEIFDCANWGPGVTLNKNVKRDTSATNKFRCEGGITRDLHDFISELHALAYPSWKVKEITFHPGNKIVTVPKNSKTDRTIAIEPGLNLWYQKAFGTMIRRRLLRFGVDLNSQKRNQELAKFSSLTGKLATVDFSSASDSLSVSLIRNLLPPRWFTMLDLLRSKFGSVKGSTFKYEKFSSMGNGFTFELESLIFYAIACSVVSYYGLEINDVSVYGDDVIIPVEAFNLYSEICKIYGLSVNSDKSYSLGWFRESCGSHFFRGRDCKPYYLRKVVVGQSDIYLAANSVRRLAHDSIFEYCDKRFEQCWLLLRNSVSNPCLIAEGFGDGGFISNFDEATPTRARHGIEGYHFKALVAVPLGYISDDNALLLARLKGRSVDRSLGNKTFIRNRVRISRKRLLTRRWTNLGPWI
jgi:hypothetical protein